MIKRYLLIALCLLSSSCSFWAEKKEVNPNELRLSLHSPPIQLDPRLASDGTSSLLIKMIGEGLTRLGPKGEPKLALAKDYTVTRDGKTYTFTLRRANWSNGDRITSEDFIYSWQSVLNPHFPSDNAYQLYPIKNAQSVKKGILPIDSLGLHAPDEQTLVVELENPTPYFLELLAFDPFLPVHAASSKGLKQVSKVPQVTCGPFFIESTKHGTQWTLLKNPTYWDRRHVYLEKISIAVIEDDNTALSLFEKGELDWMGAPFSPLPPDSVFDLKKQQRLHSLPGTFAYWLLLNNNVRPLNNSKVRRALSMAIDRQALVDAIGVDRIVAYSLLPPSLSLNEGPYFADANDPKVRNEAKRLLIEGLREENMGMEDLANLKYSFNNSPVHQKVAQVILEQWRETFGLELGLRSREWGVYMNMLSNNNFSIARYGWKAHFSDPIDFLEVFQPREQGGYNFTSWNNERYNSLLEETKKSSQNDRRKRYMREAERILMSEMPVIPIFFDSINYLKNKELQGVILTPLGQIDFKSAFFEGNESQD